MKFYSSTFFLEDGDKLAAQFRRLEDTCVLRIGVPISGDLLQEAIAFLDVPDEAGQRIADAINGTVDINSENAELRRQISSLEGDLAARDVAVSGLQDQVRLLKQKIGPEPMTAAPGWDGRPRVVE